MGNTVLESSTHIVDYKGLEVRVSHKDFELYDELLKLCRKVKHQIRDINLANNPLTEDTVKSLLKDATIIKESLERMNGCWTTISSDEFITICGKIKEAFTLSNEYKENQGRSPSEYSEIFLSTYALSFESIKQLLEYIQKTDPNPGLTNATAILIFIVKKLVSGIKSNKTTKEFLDSLKKLICDGKIILINEFNRLAKAHKSKIIEQERKFMFQLSFTLEFNDEYYDEWTGITLACDSDWYDIDNQIQNKEMLAKYVKGKYSNYFKRIILGPLLSVIGPNIRNTDELAINTSEISETINTEVNM
ncbi:unnamed protein product [Moneuplotes crassus]|uniref:Uncharacterized protein n=1 Tax=Euplotes crassus TaxID=5936 RepID=A0AAD1XQY8_EUPCR|nr:unnamed protein product [Moneuplotes crassus]